MFLNPKVINTLGLSLDIIGALLIWKYGLPTELPTSGHVGKIMGIPIKGKVDPKQKKEYERMSTAGILLLILGFALQLISNWL